MSTKDWMKNKLDGVSSNKTYIGAVEDNNDPKRLGRCRIRVFDIFDEKNTKGEYEIEMEDLPWATPWRDVNGNSFNLPDVGKVVTVMFEDGNKNNPIYISSDHYNVNLEKKLEQLPEADYLSMKSVLYDHKTQIYVNDVEGLKIDHKFNNINIKDQSININLKDNFGKINIGSPNSTQRAILGDNFANWFDEFLNILMGGKGGPFLGNLLAPVVASPALMAQIQLYFSLKDPKILSKNVYIVDNESVAKQERVEGGAAKGSVSEGQKGDTWQSTVDENKLTAKEPVKFTPVDGSSATTFNKPPENATSPSAPSELAPEKPAHHPDIDVLLEMLRIKNYKIFTKPFELNVVAIRNQCINSGDKYTDEFGDKLYAFWKDEKDNWQLKQYNFSTVPGAEFEVSDSWISEKGFSGKELEYWTGKKGSKITMKDFYKGPVSPPAPTADSAQAATAGTSGSSGTSGTTPAEAKPNPLVDVYKYAQTTPPLFESLTVSIDPKIDGPREIFSVSFDYDIDADCSAGRGTSQQFNINVISSSKQQVNIELQDLLNEMECSNVPAKEYKGDYKFKIGIYTKPVKPDGTPDNTRTDYYKSYPITFTL